MTAVLFAALVWKVIDFLRLLTNLKHQTSAILTQLLAWVGGVVIVAVGAHAAVASNVVVPGTSLPLGKLDFGSVVLVGLLVSSFGSVGVDIKQALDGSDSSAKPSLLTPPSG